MLKCTYKNTIRLLEFYVVQTDSLPVLSLRGCLDLKLIELIYSADNETEASYVKNSVNASDNTKGTDQSIDSMLQEYADVFKGIGQFPSEHTIRLTDNAEPKVYPPRRVPIAMQEKFKAELKRMQDLDVIVPVDEPTEFVNPMVIVEKPNTRKLRICLDLKNLNQRIRREHYPIPTLDDAIAKIGNSKFYSKLDLTSGYWQVKLDYESSLLTTFNTPFGRYRSTRMPFGIKSAQEVFQKKFDEVCESLEGCFKIVDDMIISGKSKQEHDQNLMVFLQHCREKNIRINHEKCVFFTTQVSYFGHIFTSEGVKPDPTKLATITQMEPPNNKAELATILGMVNYLSCFTPNLAAITAPMRDLMKKDSEFVWDAQQDCAFKQMKEVTLFWSIKRSDITSWCLQEGFRGSNVSGWKTCCLRIESIECLWTKVCTNWKRALRYFVRLWKIPPLCLWKNHKCRVWPQALRICYEETAMFSSTSFTADATSSSEIWYVSYVQAWEKYSSCWCFV